eukprot:149845_1
MKDLMNFVLFYTLWIFSSYNIDLFWFGMVVLRNKAVKFYLFEDITQISVAVITINYEPDITDTTTKKNVKYAMEIITALGAEQYSVYCAKVHKKLEIVTRMCFIICWKYVTRDTLDMCRDKDRNTERNCLCYIQVLVAGEKDENNYIFR